MVPFAFVVEKLLIGLGQATETQPEAARGLIGQASMLTAVYWLTYPFAYIIKSVGIAGTTVQCAEQIGYPVADVVAKAVFSALIWSIARAKSDALEKGAMLAQSSGVYLACIFQCHSGDDSAEATTRVAGATTRKRSLRQSSRAAMTGLVCGRPSF